MNKEDYNKFYIQGSDHYLIPKDVFDELFDEMENWKEENEKLKAELQLYKGSLKREHEAIYRANELEEVIDKIKECINDFPVIHYSSIEKVDNKRLSGKLIPIDDLLDILNEVE